MSFEFWFASVILPLIVCCLGWGAVLLNGWHCRRRDACGRSAAPLPSLGAEDATLVSQAALQAAAHLGLPDPVLATILGLSAAAIARARENRTPLIHDRLTLVHVAPLLRLSRALDYSLGGNPESVASWMRSHNTAFGARPLDVLQTPDGPQRVLDHVQALLGSS
jgi:uncharacterized protein (DUF2384 family)